MYAGNNKTRAKEDHCSSREGGRTMAVMDIEEEGGEVEDNFMDRSETTTESAFMDMTMTTQ